jgi:5-methylcytosine-specific restriction endonuclease McrA
MSGREEFDWARMRREEDDYFASRNAEPRDIRDVGSAVMRKARQTEHRPDHEVEELARLKALPYADYLDSEHWKARSNLARERDGRQCRDCGSKQNLNVHHLTYDRLGEERLDDLITLCRGCHLARHPQAKA